MTVKSESVRECYMTGHRMTQNGCALALTDGSEGVCFLSPEGHHVAFSWTSSVLLIIVSLTSRPGCAHSRCFIFVEWKDRLWCIRPSETVIYFRRNGEGFLVASPSPPSACSSIFSWVPLFTLCLPPPSSSWHPQLRFTPHRLSQTDSSRAVPSVTGCFLKSTHIL